MPYVEYDEVEAACADCGRLFRSEEALASHRAEAHDPSPTPKEPPVTSVRCAVCRRSFSSISALSRHNRTSHTG